MATPAGNPELGYQDSLVNHLTSMARTVEDTVNRALDALLHLGDPQKTISVSEVFLYEPPINEMEITIDDQAVRLLCTGILPDEEIRLIVASLKLTNDLERMGDLAVNIGERVISLAQMPAAEALPELAPMVAAVRAMVNKSLGALATRDVALAGEVLESDDVVDNYRDQLFERLLAGMTEDPVRIAPNMQFVLATRYLERIADHATNIAEDIIFWVRGLDVRHGHHHGMAASDVTKNSSPCDTTFTPPQ